MSQMRVHTLCSISKEISLLNSLLPKVTGQSHETIADGTNVPDMCVDGASGIPLRAWVKQPGVTTPNSCGIHRHVTAEAPLSAEMREVLSFRLTA
mmetsp:Transcript_64856/g.171663  ORF Transcript_64856/g.171663 Transcript_64856/m.171663 type:complete len:95 (+) Transcript_64856:126-410(+)